MSNPSNTSNDKPRTVQDIIRAIEEKLADGDYIYRGETKCHRKPPHCGKVSSSLWREYFSDVGPFNIEVVQKEMLSDAKRHMGNLPQDSRTTSVDPNVTEADTDETTDFEILTEIQHYDGKTNLIDFTTDYLIALFFACDGHHHKNGRVILQKIEKIRNMIKYPQNPQHRVIAQKSVFVRPPTGFIEPHENELVIIPAHLKKLMLEHLRTYHGISTETIYNDLHGFIRNQGIHGGAYTRFYKGLACQNRGDQAATVEEKQKEYEESIQYYTKAIDLKPDFASAYNNRGNAYSDKGENDRAIDDFNTAIQLKPNLAEPYSNRGNTYSGKGDYDLAIDDFNKAIELRPNLAKLYVNRGATYNDKGEHDRAIDDFNTALRLDPDDFKAYNNRGVAYKNKGEHDRAIEDYNKAIDLNPDLAEAYTNRGEVYGDKGAYDRAIEDHNKAIALNPDLSGAYYNRGMVWLQQSECEKASADLTTAKTMGTDIIASFHKEYESVSDFESKHGIQLPPDIAAMLTPQQA